MGARRLICTPNPEHGIDEYQAMTEKVIALLTCTPDEFNGGAHYYDENEDEYRVRESDEPPVRRPQAESRKPSKAPPSRGDPSVPSRSRLSATPHASQRVAGGLSTPHRGRGSC